MPARFVTNLFFSPRMHITPLHKNKFILIKENATTFEQVFKRGCSWRKIRSAKRFTFNIHSILFYRREQYFVKSIGLALTISFILGYMIAHRQNV